MKESLYRPMRLSPKRLCRLAASSHICFIFLSIYARIICDLIFVVWTHRLFEFRCFGASAHGSYGYDGYTGSGSHSFFSSIRIMKSHFGFKSPELLPILLLDHHSNFNVLFLLLTILRTSRLEPSCHAKTCALLWIIFVDFITREVIQKSRELKES